MSRLNGFERVEVDGKIIWLYGPEGRTEARAITPGKYGAGDWKGTILTPPSCEIAPTIPAQLLVMAATVVSQKIWPEDDLFNLDVAGYLDKLTSISSMEAGVLVAHEAHLAWEAHRKHHGR